MMARMVPMYSHAALLCFEKNQIFQISHEIPYFGRGRKMSQEKASKNKNRVTLFSEVLKTGN